WLRRIAPLGRREDVHQHSLGEEGSDPLLVDARHPLDVGDEVAVAVPDDGPDLRVAAGRIRLHLRPQMDTVAAQELLVRLSDPLLAALPLRGTLEDLERLPEAAGLDGLEELPLRPEQAEDVGLGDAGPLRDVLGRGAVNALVGKLDQRSVEDLLAPLLLRLP